MAMTVEMNDFKAFIELFAVELLHELSYSRDIWLISCKHNPVMSTIYFYEAAYHFDMNVLILSIKFIVKKRLLYFIAHGMMN